MYLKHFNFTTPPFKSIIDNTGTMQVEYHQDVYSLFAQKAKEPGIIGLFSDEDELLKQFTQQLVNDHVSAMSFSAFPKLSADTLLFKLLPACGSMKKSLHAVDAIIQHWLHEGVKHKFIAISSLDAVSASGWKTLSMLIARAEDLGMPLTVLLTGTSESEKVFKTKSGLHALMHTRHTLRTLTRRECRDYVLAQTAEAEQAPFSTARINKIHSLAQGNIIRINQLAHLSLLACWTERASRVSRRHMNLAASEVTLPRRKRKGLTALALLTLVASAAAGWYLSPSIIQHLPISLPVPASWKHVEKPQAAQRPTLDNEVVTLPDAMHQLYQMWGYDASAEDALCPNAGRVQMKCEQGHDTLTALYQQGYPWVGELQLGSHLDYAVVAHAGKESLDLLINNRTWQVSRSWYEKHATGNYTLLHRLTPDGKESIGAGSSEKDIHWLDNTLSQALSLPATQSSGWTAELVSRTKTFQQQSGIHVDGQPGEETIIHLMRATNMVPTVTTQPGPVEHTQGKKA
jgi:general secretion pathway protein A